MIPPDAGVESTSDDGWCGDDVLGVLFVVSSNMFSVCPAVPPACFLWISGAGEAGLRRAVFELSARNPLFAMITPSTHPHRNASGSCPGRITGGSRHQVTGISLGAYASACNPSPISRSTPQRHNFWYFTFPDLAATRSAQRLVAASPGCLRWRLGRTRASR